MNTDYKKEFLQFTDNIPVYYLSENEIELVNEMLGDTMPANDELKQLLALGEKLLTKSA
ncbi:MULTISPECIES: hypothetical protein [unclassified Moraxella]|uniref:hypothetical protein n=1 Tax=unclassified Moraxella TaxID=2685852 RepID=UPI003AF81EB5